MNQELLKSLSDAIDTAIQELVSIDSLEKGDVSLQDAKLRPESTNGTLPGDTRGDSVLKPEDAKKNEEESINEDKANKADKEDKKDDKEDKKDDKEDDKDADDEDMDDEKVAKMKAKIQKYEDDKKNQVESQAITKSDIDTVAEHLKKSVVSQVEEMHKSFSDRLSQIESLVGKLVNVPQPRKSVSNLAPLAKSDEDIQKESDTLSKGEVLNKLFELQKSNDKRVDSTVISRVEMGDYSVLAERGINLK